MVTNIAWIVLVVYLMIGALRHAGWAVAASLLGERDEMRFHIVVSVFFVVATVAGSILWAHS